MPSPAVSFNMLHRTPGMSFGIPSHMDESITPIRSPRSETGIVRVSDIHAVRAYLSASFLIYF